MKCWSIGLFIQPINWRPASLVYTSVSQVLLIVKLLQNGSQPYVFNLPALECVFYDVAVFLTYIDTEPSTTHTHKDMTLYYTYISLHTMMQICVKMVGIQKISKDFFISWKSPQLCLQCGLVIIVCSWKSTKREGSIYPLAGEFFFPSHCFFSPSHICMVWSEESWSYSAASPWQQTTHNRAENFHYELYICLVISLQRFLKRSNKHCNYSKGFKL